MNPILLQLRKLKSKSDLKEWLAPDVIAESKWLEFKKELPNRRDTPGKKRLCHVFSAFANKHGGFIFFGIEDKTKRPVGIDKDDEFSAHIDSIISKISPRIDNWETINVIDLKNGKFVYIVFIKESEYFQKPHVYDRMVYVRREGSCEAVNTGPELRDIISPDKFSPESKSIMLYVFDRIKQKKEYEFIDTCYLIKLRAYLYEKVIDDPENHTFQTLLDTLTEILGEYENIRNSERADSAGGEGGAAPSSPNALIQFREKIDSFMLDFNNTHNI